MSERRRIRYRPVSFDGGNRRRPEQQAMLLAQAAARVWRIWADNDDLVEDVRLRESMQRLRQEITATDVFFSGYEIGRDDD